MNIAECREMIKDSRNIVFFGGAGTSTESGIPDFRSAEGLYHASSNTQYAPEEILSRDFFFSHTRAFYEFYKKHLIHPEARPNAAHEILVRLEQEGRLQAIITQNIDGLHQMAGNGNVLELHGSVHRNYCIACHRFHSLEEVMGSSELIPLCTECQGLVKPDVVLYQEGLDMQLLERASAYIQEADVLIVAGTSLTVQPAAGLVRYYSGDRFVLINKSVTSYDRYANFVIPDSVAKVLPALFG